jgi:hypothetical protein
VPVSTVDATWHAYADGVGHAFLDGRHVTRALCGARRLEERYDHAVASRCEDCTDGLTALMKAALVAQGPISESEQRAMWGDR